MKNTIIKILIAVACLYIIICITAYFFQETFIFFPEKLDKECKFTFSQPFEELTTTTEDNVKLNGVLFKANNSKGLIFYLHGNAGSVNSWGQVAKTYTDLNYDVLILDYRGFGKSQGVIKNENQLYADIQAVYNQLKSKYPESSIIILGYSIGTGLATELASTNKPKLLILQAPYYSLKDIMKEHYSYLPTFLLKYKLESFRYLQKCEMPVYIFHGNDDKVISYSESIKLHNLGKPNVKLITLNGQGHNGITYNQQYIREIKNILSN
ncbi:MAG: alpha/beta fold hydrolase [Bacteroidales bacterium]|nr:alpha/beta fold hydrolase [Bacteroidales bacterium]